MHRYKIGDTVRMKRHPDVVFVVLELSFSPARNDPVYRVRLAGGDSRDFIVWNDDLI